MKLVGAQLVLDTNVLVHLLRNKEAGKRINEMYNVGYRKPRAIIPVVVKGEIKAFALCNEWQQAKLDAIDSLLAKLPAADISSDDVITKYAEIDAYSRSVGREMEKK